MAPRARKTAASKPDEPELTDPAQAPLDAGPDDGQDPEPTAPAAATEPLPESEAAPDPELESGPETEPAPEPDQEAPAEPTFHWEAVAGTAPAPCRLCFPAGPPPAAGSVGCAHGQWVRVQDSD